MTISQKAFTLVELIVVVTILAILSTIGFVSYSSYLSGVRDTNRISSLGAISDGLEIYKTKNTLPSPDDYIEIKSNGTIIGYQGYVGSNVLETIDYSKNGKDPKDDIYYSYYLTKDKKYYQLLAFLEEENNLETNLNLTNNTYAIDYTDRYPKVIGKKLGILTESGTNTPIQETGITELDLDTNTIYYKAHLDDSTNISGTGNTLAQSIISAIVGTDKKSCKEILEKYPYALGSDGTYSISPTLTETIKVYCDMTTNNGNYTLIIDKDYAYLDENLMGYWDMQTTISNGNLTKLKDLSKYLNHGTCYDGSSEVDCGVSGVGPQFVKGNGVTGNAMEFDGLNDYINLGDNIEWPEAITVITLNKRNIKDTVNADGLFGNRQRNSDVNLQKGWTQRYYINNDIFQFTICLTNGSTVENKLAGYTTIVGDWFHSVGVFNPIDRKVSLYIDGIQKSSSIASLGFNSIVYDSSQPMILGYNATNNGYFPGILDEVRIYNRALSDNEIKAIYNSIK